MSFPLDHTHVFGGAGEQEFQTRGRHLRLLEAPSANVFVTLSGGGELELSPGQGLSLDAGEQFDGFRLRSTVAQTVRVRVSSVPQADDQQDVAVNVTANVAPGNTLTTTADAAVPAASAATVIAARADRLGVLIKNPSANAAPVRVGEVGAVGAAAGHELDPGDSVFFATTAAVAVYNTDAAAQSVCVTEVREV